jgi:hypothetical protein
VAWCVVYGMGTLIVLVRISLDKEPEFNGFCWRKGVVNGW